ncbi:MAG TPA: aspartate ammonia-lyase [Candidatus Desulfovibrio gallistercoris]|uniref:aspartate ammonia-lyase n=1 Tax=uncultured Desulfovibrio sp. TaxID=167968 RepID=UPI001FA49C0C|nr:aspartate ammonia-lyase [uncultured Desulfovibrio sp.]HJA75763.1 aspartate ammonia-lyase [Candidatus Desulfovibrio gallistercoris]
MSETRKEHDFLGELDIPADIYYGIQTYRAVENFKISGISISILSKFIQGMACVKKAAALANCELGVLSQEKCEAICKACDEVVAGKFDDQFPVDVFQGGAGTSCNMNANEVIANRALEIMGHKKGEYQYCHPNNDVNCSQSTNDAYPTAMRIALYAKLTQLIGDMDYLRQAFADKAEEFRDVIKMGRTQLQDAVPMTLGMEFAAYAETIREDMMRVGEARNLIAEINMGATAIGTGINSPEGYAALVTRKLREVSGVPVEMAGNMVEATSDTGAYVQLSGVLKRCATKISKICNDLRLLSSGPRCGLNEINLPPRQPGSSIMPGKVNPVMPEVMNQICFDIIGKDVTITLAAEAGQLELNVMEPVIAYSLFSGMKRLGAGCRSLVDYCIRGITANRERCRDMVYHSIGIVTALNPYLGYETSASIAREALESGRSLVDIVRERGLMSEEQLEEVLAPEHMLQPGKWKK